MFCRTSKYIFVRRDYFNKLRWFVKIIFMFLFWFTLHFLGIFFTKYPKKLVLRIFFQIFLERKDWKSLKRCRMAGYVTHSKVEDFFPRKILWLTASETFFWLTSFKIPCVILLKTIEFLLEPVTPLKNIKLLLELIKSYWIFAKFSDSIIESKCFYWKPLNIC